MDLKKEDIEMKIAVNEAESSITLERSAIAIVHEIRNPLTTIKGFLQLLKPHLKEAGKEQYADVILDEIKRTNEIVDEFLQYARREVGLNNETPLNKIVEDIILLFDSEAFLKNVEITATLTNEDTALKISANHLKQVLTNLIKNAIEALDESQTRIIHLSTQNNGERATIEITDSGCGMSEEMIKNLFTPFYSSKEKGTGVGLCVCKQIIEDYGGSILVKSTIGNGTTFSITFPIKG